MTTGARKDSFANQVRMAVKALTAKGTACSTSNIATKAGVWGATDRKRMSNALRDMTRAGELTRVQPGVYALVDRQLPAEKRVIMWRLLRQTRVRSVADLVEMAGVSTIYAQEWLQTLVKQGVVRQGEDGNYRLLKDTVEMPELTENADKLRALREKKKQAVLTALDCANQALGKARAAINEL